jgi:hypothetical protein
MGMSDDFPVAIEEGATLVRIGRALFGERPDHGPDEHDPQAFDVGSGGTPARSSDHR